MMTPKLSSLDREPVPGALNGLQETCSMQSMPVWKLPHRGSQVLSLKENESPLQPRCIVVGSNTASRICPKSPDRICPNTTRPHHNEYYEDSND